ncbi:hypothetical protein GQ55_2G243700 [Panicum hallii var. hallii]|uniref:Uncharacterized protein n=1 Tax=Panicum hallii var. hallii TaxID=1504633 RepID=A0A2T7ERZ1_9POAL|nr:hypothetical protein GQ55_2G243700 [Panicum hallii var. hallii]
MNEQTFRRHGHETTGPEVESLVAATAATAEHEHHRRCSAARRTSRVLASASGDRWDEGRPF